MTDSFKRAIAALVDFYIILAISSLLVAIVTLGKLTLTTFTTCLYLVSCLVLVVSKDFVFKNASVGKRIFNLRVVKEDGTKFTLVDAIKRTLPFILLLPIECVMLISRNKRIGDTWAKTSVV